MSTDTPARLAAIELLAALTPAAFVVDGDRAVDIAAEFLALQQRIVREGTARDMVARIRAYAGSAESATVGAWGEALAGHLGKVWGCVEADGEGASK